MNISVFDLFSIGIGPSSSHTVGPMRAAAAFVSHLVSGAVLERTARVGVELFGSLALTGEGHGTDRSVLLGLEGELPETVDPAAIPGRIEAIRASGSVLLGGVRRVVFAPADLVFNRNALLPRHSNGMAFEARDADGGLLLHEIYYSVGGGFIVDENGAPVGGGALTTLPPYPFHTAQELLGHCRDQQCRISDIVLKNELTWRSEEQIRECLLDIYAVMRESVDAGLVSDGTLPGPLRVRRRAPALYRRFVDLQSKGRDSEFETLELLSVYAIAVNEQNASCGRIVTAPTNGAAGVIPAVLCYYTDHLRTATDEGIRDFLLTAGAIGVLFKEGASLSAAEVGCQGEVGVACSMAAGALAAVLGGTVAQVENAAEIGMEHNLGLTCDPVGGFVQIPCIERNAMGAVKAVNAARLALLSDGSHVVSLDRVIAAMRSTGQDMAAKYKETSLGGLAIAVAVPEC